MAKVTEMNKKAVQQVDKHTRHAYQELTAVSNGFTKVAKDGKEDKSKIYITLFCSICGGTKEIVAASGLPVEKDNMFTASIEGSGALDVAKEHV